jgi:hypothetical protein
MLLAAHSRSRLLACAMLLLTAACAAVPPETEVSRGIDPQRMDLAVRNASALKAAGRRVWCVPFARDVSGVEIKGNAGTWWRQAGESYARGHKPAVGAVMAFSSTRKLPLGHVAVVSQVLSEREVLIDHANWKRGQISLGMAVIDVSEKNDWSAVRVLSQPDSFGSVYAVDGFIFPRPHVQ